MSRELLYQRHSALVATYQRYSSDRDVLAEHHEFVRDDEADRAAAPASYGVRMAIKYFRRLFKERSVEKEKERRESAKALDRLFRV